MTYFLKDCGREVSPPAKEREDIARAAAETFATRPYIRFALFIEPYADGSGDDSVELIAVPDRRFGVPLVPWAATGCEEFAYDLVAALGRDVDCCLDKCERARLSLIHRTLMPIYRRPDSAIEPADRYLTSASAALGFPMGRTTPTCPSSARKRVPTSSKGRPPRAGCISLSSCVRALSRRPRKSSDRHKTH